jgi:CRP-like cAMP-binding protein
MAARADAPNGANHLLSAITASDRSAIARMCEPCELVIGDVVCEPNAPIRQVFFPTTSYISLITPEGAAESLEVGLVGSEGMFGTTLILGIGTSPLKGLVQGSGMAMRMSPPDFVRAFGEYESFRRVVNAYLYILMSQIAQTAACGRYHHLEPRLARWILMTHDRAATDTFRLTHVFLAQMLGVRRAGVTEAAGLLQGRGLIQYRRGSVQVLNRAALEAISCPCYGAANSVYRQHLGTSTV